MRQIMALAGAKVLQTYLRLMQPGLRVVQMRSCHVEAATKLLATEFCRREPLCRALGIEVSDLYDFFREQVQFSASKGFGLVVENREARVVGAMTVEDHMDQMPVDPSKLPPKVALIGDILNSVDLPFEWQPEACGEVYYCGIGAADYEFRRQDILLTLIIGSYLHMTAKGFRMGYAKVSNRAVIGNMMRIQKAFRISIFKFSDEKKKEDLPQLDPYPSLQNFSVTLVKWSVLARSEEARYVLA